MDDRKMVILQAPSSLGLSSDGADDLAAQLLRMGLATRLGAKLASTVTPPSKSGSRDPVTGILNLQEIVNYTPVLAEAFAQVLEDRQFPLVLGGDCTILLGPLLALRRRGRYGLLFIDGHADFFQPEAEPNGEGSSMELAWATGYGPAVITNLGGLHPLIRPEDVVVFGFRDHDDQRNFGSQPLPKEVVQYDLPRLRDLGVHNCAREAVRHLSRSELGGFFIHLDVDVLADDVMPAVDFRIMGGLALEELVEVLRLALESPKAVGMDVTIYNPHLDGDGHAGRSLMEALCLSVQ